MTNIQFGGQPPINVNMKRRERTREARAGVGDDGLEQNGHTQYNHETSFVNIKTAVNVCRIKDDDAPGMGVAKGAILANVPVTVPSNTSAATMHAMKKRCDHAPSLDNTQAFKRGHELLMEKFIHCLRYALTRILYQSTLLSAVHRSLSGCLKL